MVIEVLENITEVQSGYRAKGKIKESPAGSHRLLQARDIFEGAINWNTAITFNPDIDPTRYQIRQHDILFVARGYENKAYLAVEPPQNTLASNMFYIIRPHKIQPGFLAWWLNEREAQAYFGQFQVKMGFAYMSKKNLFNLKVPIPDKSTQTKISDVLQLWQREQQLISEINEAKEKIITSVLLSAID
jgi:restriction endonuclease S subunit